MKPLPLWRRYARFFGPDPAADVKDELRFHIETKTDDLIARRAGVPMQPTAKQYANLEIYAPSSEWACSWE